MMQRIAIHGREVKPESVQFVSTLFGELVKRKVEVTISSDFLVANKGVFGLSQFPVYGNKLSDGQVDSVFSLGGDGTILETILHVARTNVPILGINTGRLGFLASTAKETIPESLELLFTGQYSLEERTLIQLDSPLAHFDHQNFAMNEFAILRKETSSMIMVKCYIDGEYLNTYWADGLMVSTPTGSTGYSLSCGGPIVMPETQTFVITPVSPHNLNIRPLVIPDNRELKFEVESRDTNLLVSLDSRSETVSNDLKFCLRKADFKIKLVKLKGNSFLDTLRNKLGWGFDRRN
jgi:NAD+ kinase